MQHIYTLLRLHGKIQETFILFLDFSSSTTTLLVFCCLFYLHLIKFSWHSNWKLWKPKMNVGGLANDMQSGGHVSGHPGQQL